MAGTTRGLAGYGSSYASQSDVQRYESEYDPPPRSYVSSYASSVYDRPSRISSEYETSQRRAYSSGSGVRSYATKLDEYEKELDSRGTHAGGLRYRSSVRSTLESEPLRITAGGRDDYGQLVPTDRRHYRYQDSDFGSSGQGIVETLGLGYDYKELGPSVPPYRHRSTASYEDSTGPPARIEYTRPAMISGPSVSSKTVKSESTSTKSSKKKMPAVPRVARLTKQPARAPSPKRTKALEIGYKGSKPSGYSKVSQSDYKYASDRHSDRHAVSNGYPRIGSSQRDITRYTTYDDVSGYGTSSYRYGEGSVSDANEVGRYERYGEGRVSDKYEDDLAKKYGDGLSYDYGDVISDSIKYGDGRYAVSRYDKYRDGSISDRYGESSYGKYEVGRSDSLSDKYGGSSSYDKYGQGAYSESKRGYTEYKDYDVDPPYRPSKIGREDYEAGSRDGAIVVDGDSVRYTPREEYTKNGSEVYGSDVKYGEYSGEYRTHANETEGMAMEHPHDDYDYHPPTDRTDNTYDPPYDPPTKPDYSYDDVVSESSSGSKLKYIIYALGALVVLYVMNRGVGLFRGKSSARLSCGYYEFSACKEQGCIYEPESKSCYLPSPAGVVQQAELTAPYKFLFVGYPSAGTTSCVNSMVKAYGGGSYLRTYGGPSERYQKTAMDKVELYDTPGMDLTTDLDAFYKVRKYVGGIQMNQNLTSMAFGWTGDKAHAASRLVLVLDTRMALKGWLWHSVKQSGIANFTAQLEKVDTALPVSPLVILNTAGYKAKTSNRVKEALKKAYYLPAHNLFSVDCSYMRPLELSKILYGALLEHKYSSLRIEDLIA